jgi:hypothetical protein
VEPRLLSAPKAFVKLSFRMDCSLGESEVCDDFARRQSRDATSRWYDTLLSSQTEKSRRFSRAEDSPWEKARID